MEKFKTGDRLGCVNGSNSDEMLFVGDVYTVVDTRQDGAFVELEGMTGPFWLAQRFILVED